ncbi:eukaryotic translation initiation factor 2C 4 [Trichuris trichiura]|uniref:Eukaryotic translation initiation factor 2C 4 n=1 Tax=Trichuris trichiura TaxID=36087 RepID=A0A077YYT6_TRITR|nr:eukaryotic translation initiation factor 2C 4 [Trichuris trichiura]
MTVYHYNISIEVEGKFDKVDVTKSLKGFTSAEAKELCICVYKSLFEKKPHCDIFRDRFLCAYDGRANIYTLKELALGRKSEYRADTVTPNGKALTITVKPCSNFELNIEDVIQSLMVRSPEDDRSSLQALDVLTTKTAPFFAGGPLLESVADELQLQQIPFEPLTQFQVNRLKLRFKGVKVKAIHTNHRFKITDFTTDTANTRRFQPDSQSAPINVYGYFLKQYGIKLKYPNLPLAIKGKCAFPIELLNVLPGQRVALTKLTDVNQREIIKLSAVPPYQRRNDIMAKVKEIGLDEDDKFGKALGIRRSDKMMAITGRVLPDPSVLYHSVGQGCNSITVRNGVWDMRDLKVFLSANVDRWAVANFCRYPKNQVEEFMRRLVNKARNMGVKMSNTFANYANLEPSDVESLHKYFEHLIRIDQVTFVLCLMPDSKDGILKNRIKFVGEVLLGLTTQCLRAQTVKKGLGNFGTDTLFLQVMLKVNAKNGGVNNEVNSDSPITERWIRKGVMFLGFDVNHPPPLSQAEIMQGRLPQEPSVVGAVCNCGRTFSDYRIRYRLQDARQENIDKDKMIGIVTEFLGEYEQNNKALPTSVIVYRDGVADNQFSMVFHTEMRFINQAFRQYKQDYSPKLTMVVVQKRHHTRFFRQNISPKDKCAVQNIPPGTVVDVGPVSAKLFDFFLCSHVGIQGTSKPCQYTVLYDDNGFDADSIQMLSYLLCQTYQRCNRSVSLPAPVYHAHHAATRGKDLYMAFRDTLFSKAKFGARVEQLPMDAIEKKINMHDNVSRQMVWA